MIPPRTPCASGGYQLRVDGHLDDHWSTWFDGLTLIRETDGTTSLRAVVADQAELHGLLAKIRDLGLTLISVTRLGVSSAATPVETTTGLSPARLHLMRAGYLLMGVGLVLVKWPQLPGAHDQPLYEGVTLCLLVAMSLLAFLGLRYPVKLLPVLLFESLWKVLWLGFVALPSVVDGTVDTDMSAVMVNCSLVILIIAVIPWRYVWRTYALAPGDRWR